MPSSLAHAALPIAVGAANAPRALLRPFLVIGAVRGVIADSRSLALEREYRIDSLVLAFEQGIQQAEERRPLTTEERCVVVVEALERKVNHGGYHQFLPQLVVPGGRRDRAGASRHRVSEDSGHHS